MNDRFRYDSRYDTARLHKRDWFCLIAWLLAVVTLLNVAWILL